MARLDDLHNNYLKAKNDLLKEVQHVASKSDPRNGDDISQETVLFVWQNLETFKPSGNDSFSRWVSSTTRYKKLDTLKAKNQHLSSEGMIEEAVEDDTVFIDVSQLTLQMVKIAALIRAGFNLKEVAETLGMKEGTLRKRLHSFRKRVTKDSCGRL